MSHNACNTIIPNIVMSRLPSSSSYSSSSTKHDKLMESAATLATESSSTASIDATFLTADASHLCDGKSSASQGNIVSCSAENDALFFEDDIEAGADEAAGVAALRPGNVLAYLRPRRRELHHLALAMDILEDIENEDESSDTNESISFEHLESSLADLLRPQKKERHYYSIYEDILRDFENDGGKVENIHIL